MSNAMIAQEVPTREWVAANAELIESARPRWADAERVDLDYCYGEVDSVGFAREVGDVVVEQWFALDGGELTPLQGAEIRILTATVDDGVFDPSEAARIATCLMAAALVLGSDATVSDLRNASAAVSLSPGELYAAMGGNL